jgi:hypothetical protein
MAFRVPIAEGLLTMVLLAYRCSRALWLVPLLLALLLPTAASAEWGTENWGEMVWGGVATPIPSMPAQSLVALAILLLLGAAALLARRRRIRSA